MSGSALAADLPGGDVYAATYRPDVSGRLRMVWEVGSRPAPSQGRVTRRRDTYLSGRECRIPLSDGAGRAMAMFPLVAYGRSVGVLEVAAPCAAIDERWHALGSLAARLGADRALADPGDRRLGDLDGEDAGRRAELADMGLALTAHEIRGPLLGVRAGLETLLRRASADPEEVDLLRRAVRELEHLAGATEELLVWAAGVRSPERRSGDVVAVVHEAVDACRLETGVDRVVVHAPYVLYARIDATQLRSAVANLVRNALAYADPGTKVEVTAGDEGDAVRISVRNEGPAIPASQRLRIFDPFVRGNVAGGAGRRSGLGLYIARRVAEEHGGRIWVESDPSGATFHMRLPREEESQRFAS